LKQLLTHGYLKLGSNKQAIKYQTHIQKDEQGFTTLLGELGSDQELNGVGRKIHFSISDFEHLKDKVLPPSYIEEG